MTFPPKIITDHGSEVGLLTLIAAGVIGVLLFVIHRGVEGWDVAACLLVLQRVIEAVTARWGQRSVDKMGAQLAASVPTTEEEAKK